MNPRAASSVASGGGATAAGASGRPVLPARASSGSVGSGAAAARRPARARLACRAQQQGGDGPSRPSAGGGGTDWDAAWARYQRGRAPGAGGATTRTAAPGGGVRFDPSARLARDAIRRQESVLLNLWTQPAFQGGMAFVAVVVLIAFAATAGPPPMDDRCTLPWC
ncbi:hypothetical protein Rsub_08676 [Raphidocelis subcapitata]|uniref:Uncharacterized protein n=1 Tax=Raphidocelis subcapitata TaxID=307507 RepID=A0A2V0P746_9CHLO|nr:hypothetical protein Rsub_08676 [Raphidocelis subcapitata]|eukprot:GBF95694.1 hypothetical protein Rsub_08676 [Raphidocelis subcapitata]